MDAIYDFGEVFLLIQISELENKPLSTWCGELVPKILEVPHLNSPLVTQLHGRN
jgi:hypothetical protein